MKWRTALITGGTTGIGASMARQLAAQGTRVAICGRRKEMLDELAPSLGDSAVLIQADVGDPHRAVAVVKEAAEKLGSLDLVIANAGTGRSRPAHRLQVEDIIEVLNLNVLGACATLTAAIPYMVAQKRGHLVGISSLAAYNGLPSSAAYSASKAALSTFLESIRVDLFRQGIKVTDVRPGFIDTPLTKKNKFKMPFLMSADEGAARILRALEREKRLYAFPWPTAMGARLLTIVPRWIYDRFGSRVEVEKG